MGFWRKVGGDSKFFWKLPKAKIMLLKLWNQVGYHNNSILKMTTRFKIKKKKNLYLKNWKNQKKMA